MLQHGPLCRDTGLCFHDGRVHGHSTGLTILLIECLLTMVRPRVQFLAIRCIAGGPLQDRVINVANGFLEDRAINSVDTDVMLADVLAGRSHMGNGWYCCLWIVIER